MAQPLGSPHAAAADGAPRVAPAVAFLLATMALGAAAAALLSPLAAPSATAQLVAAAHVAPATAASTVRRPPPVPYVRPGALARPALGPQPGEPGPAIHLRPLLHPATVMAASLGAVVGALLGFLYQRLQDGEPATIAMYAAGGNFFENLFGAKNGEQKMGNWKPGTKKVANCQACRNKGAVTCPGCNGKGRSRVNGNMMERFK
eukprot:EG_transcript_30801